MVYKYFNINSKNKQSAEELHKPIIRKFEKREVYQSYNDNIQSADLAHMQVTSKVLIKRFLLCAIDIFSKYAQVVPLNDEK